MRITFLAINVLLILLAMVEASSGNGHVVPTGDLGEMARSLTNSLYASPDRVWPGCRWTKLQILLLDPRNSSALLWNDARNSDPRALMLTPINYTDLPPNFRLPSGSYHSDQWLGRPVLIVAIDAFRDPVQTVIHESFHEIGQEAFTESLTGKMRGGFYPEDWRPRYLRSQIVLSLYKAFTVGESNALGAAAYWSNKLHKRHPDDERRSRPFDIHEGSAEYVGIVGSALGKLGSGASESELTTQLRHSVKDTWESCLPDGLNEVDAEPYMIGALAGLLLREKGVARWQERVEKGETPLGILLSDIPAIPQLDDPKHKARVREIWRKKNLKLGVRVKQLLESIRSPKYCALSVPLTWLTSSFSGEGFVTAVTKARHHTLVLGMEGKFESPDKSCCITLSKFDVEVRDQLPSGKEPQIVVPLPRTALKMNKDGSYSVDLPSVKVIGARADLTERAKG